MKSTWLLLLLLLFLWKCNALFEWIHPESWRSKKPMPSDSVSDEQLVNKTTQSGVDTIKQSYKQAKEKLSSAKDKISSSATDKLAQKTSDIKDQVASIRDEASESLFNPIKRFFTGHHHHHEDDEEVGWLRDVLSSVTASSFRTFPEEYILFVDVPGIPAEHLQVSIEKARLHVRGQFNTCIKASSYSKVEEDKKVCVQRSVDRSFSIPEDVDSEGVGCAWKDGVLITRFPRIEIKGRQVPIVPEKQSWF